jgi:hypothetical protein
MGWSLSPFYSSAPPHWAEPPVRDVWRIIRGTVSSSWNTTRLCAALKRMCSFKSAACAIPQNTPISRSSAIFEICSTIGDDSSLSRLAGFGTSAQSMKTQRLTSAANQRSHRADASRWRADEEAKTPAIDHRLDMSLSKSCAVFGALVLISCGSPAELEEGDFPSLNDTGYNVSGNPPVGGGAAGSGTQTVVPGAAGSGALGNAGGGNAGGGSVGGGSGGSGGMMAAGGCPPDITTLFARPSAQGGCTQGGGCHEATSPIKPDMVSPGLASRLFNVPSNCSLSASGASVGPRPYIGATDSFLEEKLGTDGARPGCGELMPFFMDYALSAADRQCIFNWIDQVAAGGG